MAFDVPSTKSLRMKLTPQYLSTVSPCVKPVKDRQAAQLPVNLRLLHEEGVLGQQTHPQASAHQDRPQGLHCRGRILRE